MAFNARALESTKLARITVQVLLLLLITGINIGPRYRLVYATIYLSLLAVLIIGSVIGFITSHAVADKLKIFSITSPQFASIFVFYFVSTSKSNILGLLAKLNNRKVIGGANIFVRRKLLWITIVLVLMGNFTVAPNIFYSLYSARINDMYSFVVPRWFSCGDGDISSILKSLCWRVNTKLQLILSNGIQFAVGGMLFVFDLATVALCSIMMYEFSIHMEIFTHEVQNMIALMKQLNIHPGESNERRMSQYEQIICNQLIEIIKRQQFLNSCAIDLVSTWKSHMSTYAIGYFLCVATLLFTIITEKDGATIMVIKAICLNAYLFTGFVMICSHAASISDLNEYIFDKMCTIPWYQQGIKFRKLYAIMLTLNRKSTKVTVLRMHELGMNTVILLFRRTYSVLNVMLVNYRVQK